MNDFTKEELELIRQCISIPYAHPKRRLAEDIYTKLTQLIEKYCEHKKTMSDSAMQTYCCYCDAILPWDGTF